MSSRIVSWITDSGLDSIPTSTYWNSPEIEQRKEWYVNNVKDLTAIRYLRQDTNLEEGFLAGIKLLEAWLGHELRGVCLDLGAGVCWTSAILAKKPDVERVYAVEMSKHRLLNLAPIILDQYGAPTDKVIRVLGDFCDIKLQSASVDTVVLAQAFHHSKDITRLLSEVVRVLVPGGSVIVTGEKPVVTLEYLRKVFRYNLRGLLYELRLDKTVSLILGRNLRRPLPLFTLSFETLFPTDVVKGDHAYSLPVVQNMFEKTGLKARFQRLTCDTGKELKSSCNYIALKQ